jgi:hypothetical protein
MNEIKKFASSTLGTVVITVAVVYMAEKYLGTALPGIPSALKAKFSA